ncbi:MAG: hypothetical protein AAFZ63_25205 [Bacteroidota bacterium]
MNWELLDKNFKISVIRIVRDHFGTIVHAQTGKAGPADYVAFLILPMLLSILFVSIGFDVNGDSIETIVGSLAIFVGLLFNALVILIDVARKADKDDTMRKEIIREITANISFSIFLSFVTIFIMLLGFLPDKTTPNWASVAINIVSFFLLAEFMMIFLMVLKRTYLIFDTELAS